MKKDLSLSRPLTEALRQWLESRSDYGTRLLDGEPITRIDVIRITVITILSAFGVLLFDTPLLAAGVLLLCLSLAIAIDMKQKGGRL